MRLGTKIFLTSALVIVVLAGVGVLSLRAVGRLVSANREIATRTIPALRLTASAREAIPPLVRLEARVVVLGDARYATAWTERAARVADDLERLAEFPLNQSEAVHFNAARAAFEGYRRIVAEEQALIRRGGRGRVPRAHRGREPRRDRGPRAVVQLDGKPAARGGGDEDGVLRDRLARAPVAAHVDPWRGRPRARGHPRPAHPEAGPPH